MLSKLGLGSVQWGLKYGIANTDGQPSLDTVRGLLDQAAAAGIDLVDTASAYGEAEAVLGAAEAGARFQVVSKTAAGTPADLPGAIRKSFAQSLERLHLPQLAGLLVHDPAHLLGPQGRAAWALLEEFKAAGQVGKIGVSVYSPAQLDRIRAEYPIDLVQLPLNLYDQRFIQSASLPEARRAGVEIHVRSAFLQGLLLLAPEALSEHFAAIRDHHRRLRRAMQDGGWSPLEAALGFCLAQPDVDRVIVGCETPPQLDEIIAAARRAGTADFRPLAAYAIADEAITVPVNWPRH